jgi:hypothetical protein
MQQLKEVATYIKKLEKEKEELLTAVNRAMNYVGDDMYHYEDVGDEEALAECKETFNALHKVYKKVNK